MPLPTTALMDGSGAAAAAASALPPPSANSGSGHGQQYDRIAYYDSVSQTVDNLVFLGNFGGQGSGVFTE